MRHRGDYYVSIDLTNADAAPVVSANPLSETPRASQNPLQASDAASANGSDGAKEKEEKEKEKPEPIKEEAAASAEQESEDEEAHQVTSERQLDTGTGEKDTW
jgi:hypothetical protein